MVKAILAEFPCSNHVLCTRHLKENTRHYMTTEDRQVILEKSYGTDGLVNAMQFNADMLKLFYMCNIRTVLFSYYLGLWQAIRTVFPETNRKGCIFHWAQAVLRHVGEVGLKRTYEERQGAHQLIRKLLALPFLPVPHIRRAFERLRQKADTSSQPMRDLFEYAENQWIESSLWSESDWSVYRQTIRTNNDVEGWHRRLNAKAGKPSLKLYVLLPLLLREAKLVNLKYQLVSDAALGRHRRARYSRMDGEISDLWDQYDSNEVSAEEFLLNIGNIYCN